MVAQPDVQTSAAVTPANVAPAVRRALGSATPAGTVDLTGSGVAVGFGVAVTAGAMLGVDDGVGGVAGADVATGGAGTPHATRHRKQTATHPNPSLEWPITSPS